MHNEPEPPSIHVHLSHLTLTGADDSVDPIELARLSAEAPLLEWGILLSAEDEGRPRFPSRAWRDALHRAAPQIRCAAHVCGEAMLAATAATGLAGPYQRMQLNFDRRALSAVTLRAWVQAAQRRGGAGCDKWPAVWITQHNEANACLHELFSTAASPAHAVLFDASAGLGLSPANWPSAIPGISCGYAGGLGPDNLACELPRIAAAAAQGGAGDLFWIDMEARLRTGNRFDLDRVRAVIEAVRASACGEPLAPGVQLVLPAVPLSFPRNLLAGRR